MKTRYIGVKFINRRISRVDRKKYVALLFCFYLLCYFLPLGARDLTIPDETRYGEIPREMLESGNWVSPHLNGARYFEKPAFGYWIHAGAIRLLGENNFAVRFPSALAVGLTALSILLLLRFGLPGERGKNIRGEELSAAIFLSSLGVFGIGNMAVLDNLFSFFTTGTAICFFLATESLRGSSKEKVLCAAAGLFCGLAFLTKGFLAFALPAVIFVPYLLWIRRSFDILRMAWFPLLTAAFVALPWAIAIHLREPDYWRFFFWNEHIRRFLSGNSAQHIRPFWFFFLVGPLLALPWSFFAPAAVAGLRTRASAKDGRERLVRFCLCWLLFPFLLFSASSGKLPTYILPCMPPFALLAAVGLSCLAHESLGKSCHRSVYANIAFFSALMLIFSYVQLFGYDGFRPYMHGWKAVMVWDCFVFFTLFCLWANRAEELQKKIVRIALAPVLLFVSINLLVPDLTLEMKMPGAFIEKYSGEIPRDTIVITEEETAGAVCWYLKREDVYILGGAGELGYGLDREGEGRNIGVDEASLLIERHPGKVLLLARSKTLDRWKAELPPSIEDERSGFSGYFALQRY